MNSLSSSKILFPSLTRKKLDTLQINLTLKCNQACVHCHVDAGPKRTEEMDKEGIQHVLEFIKHQNIRTLDITGGAPELHPEFRYLVEEARKLNVRVIDRCNLTILFEPGQETLADFLATQKVDIVASLPCYLEKNVDSQRGKGVFEKSIRALKLLNQHGYGMDGSQRTIDLVYNPQGAVLPPGQTSLENQYKDILLNEYDIQFNHLFVLCNMPINRFAHSLKKNGCYNDYLSLLKSAHKDSNLADVMCRSLISVDWQGYVYDCDFNQMLDLPLGSSTEKTHISELIDNDMNGQSISVNEHCFACTAGQGSSCGGALQSS